MFSTDTPSAGCSADAHAILTHLFQSGQSEDYGVADILNTIASNDGDLATDDHLVGSAEQIIEAALAFIVAVAPDAPASYVKGEDVRAGLRDVSAYLGGLETLDRLARQLGLDPLYEEDGTDDRVDADDDVLVDD